MLISCKSLAMGTTKGLGSLALGGAIFWQVGSHCGSMKAVAYVHVATLGVDVTVDDQTYRVESLWETPIVCELRPGRHLLRMLRSGRVLFEQEFALDPGQEIVLTAWEGTNEKPAEELPPIVLFNPSLSRSRLDGKSPRDPPALLPHPREPARASAPCRPR
jgi:hypothetical protein